MENKGNENRRECRMMEVCELRAEENEPGTPTIAGYAAVFNERTDLGYFTEVIKPGAFKRAIKEGQDVRALWNHDPNYVLGRTKAGTLRLEEDKRGLKIEIDPPATNFADDLIESIRRGDVDQMSFAFTAVEEKWTEKDDEPTLRELVDVNLYDVSAVTYPAYDATTVGVRSADAVYQEHIQSLDVQEPESDDDVDRSGLESDRARAIVDVTRLKTN
jgi:HK97 family phage prohead protease